MALNIKNPEVERMARELARRRKLGITEAVKEALELELKRVSQRPRNSGLLERIRKIQDEVAKLPVLDARSVKEITDDLYGEDGAPK
jgi:antitoxin VapB